MLMWLAQGGLAWFRVFTLARKLWGRTAAAASVR
jgi:hypothetical protein